MAICFFVIVFFAVIATGPAGIEWRDRRRQLADRPIAKVMYLPSAACRGESI